MSKVHSKIPQKKEKPSAEVKRFADAHEIRAALQDDSAETLRESLIILRNQLTIRHNDTQISPQDERLILAQTWLGSDPSAGRVFAIWETATLSQNSLIAAAVSLLATALTLLSTHFSYHTYGHAILKTLLSHAWTSRLNGYLSGNHTEVILITLKLYNSMSDFANGKERKNVLEAFPWELKSLPRLLNMRRKGKEVIDSLVRPDIRTLYALFLVSFIKPTSSSQLKTAFLEQHKDALVAVFKGLWQDHYSLVRLILEVCWEGIWSDVKLKRTSKISVFGESTLGHLLKLYARASPENEGSDSIPADVVHHFLLAVCSRPGFGLCFKERGWYPRETEDEEGTRNSGAKIYNKILAQFLKTLQVNEDPRQQELALKILAACPELIAGYWPAANLTMEPRLSSKWITNISFFGQVISLPPPVDSFLLSSASTSTKLYNPAPPPLHTIMSNILPTSVNPKVNFSKGLQSASPLVQHCTAQALSKVLTKYRVVLAALLAVEQNLDEREEDGLWTNRRREVEFEMRMRVPDFQVIVGFSQTTAQNTGDFSTKAALLSESAQRLQWLYHEYLPGLVAEARFDVGKLLAAFGAKGKDKALATEDADMDVGATDSVTHKFEIVKQLHILRLLQQSDQFTWSTKSGSGSSLTYLHILLKAYVDTSTSSGTKTALANLLQHTLSQSILFQDDPSEVSLWLFCLPVGTRSADAEAPDGGKLSDERETVVAFLDECAARCSKTPYRYMDEMVALGSKESEQQQMWSGDIFPSPLLMTVVEQLQAKVSHGLFNASELLASVTFLRKLVRTLAQKQADLEFLNVVVTVVVDGLKSPLDGSFADTPMLKTAILREIDLMRFTFTRSLLGSPPQDSLPAVDGMLTQAEALPVASTLNGRIRQASELVDYVKLVGLPFTVQDLQRVIAMILKLHPTSLRSLIDSLDPRVNLLWYSFNLPEQWDEVDNWVTFDSLLLHLDHATVALPATQSILVSSWHQTSPTLARMKQSIQLLLHIITGKVSELSFPYILLLCSILRSSTHAVHRDDYIALKAFVFNHSSVKAFLVATPENESASTKAIGLILAVLDHREDQDRDLVADSAMHWFLELKEANWGSNPSSLLSYGRLWLRFIPPDNLLDLLRDQCSRGRADIIQDIATALADLSASQKNVDDLFQSAQKDLVVAKQLSPALTSIDELISRAVSSGLPTCLDGEVEWKNSVHLGELFGKVDAKWMRMLKTRTAEDIDPTFNMGLTPSAMASSLYARPTPTPLSDLIQLSNLEGQSIPVFHAFLDILMATKQQRLESFVGLGEALRRCVKLVFQEEVPPETRRMAGECVAIAAHITPKTAEWIVSTMHSRIKKLSLQRLTSEILHFAISLAKRLPGELSDEFSALLDLGLRWSVEFVVEWPAQSRLLRHLSTLANISSGCLPSTLETFLLALVREQLDQSAALELAQACLRRTNLKPFVVNRTLQSILQHTNFFALAAHSSSTRTDLIDLVHTLFHLHPSNTCQASHIEPLVGLYNGTLAKADQMLLSIFQLFEDQRKTSVASVFRAWSATSGSSSSTTLDAVRSLDPALALKTALHGPLRRSFGDVRIIRDYDQGGRMYDPVFVILLFSSAMQEILPRTGPAWVELFRTNAVSVVIRSLSSKVDALRRVALSSIAALSVGLERSDMVEKHQVMYTLNQLKNCLEKPSNEQAPSPRLSSYTTLLFAHSLRGIFYPSNFIYPITSRFLLQRPEIDVNDVPMLFSMLYSGSNEEWKKERGWILRFLTDGMAATQDFKVLKRRHTWDLLASLFQSTERDVQLRASVLEFLANATSCVYAANYLVLKSGLLSWIECQLVLTFRENEALAWARILENIIVVADLTKLEGTTGGAWRQSVCRCLLILFNHTNLDDNLAWTIDLTLCSILHRLLSLKGQNILRLEEVIQRAVEQLEKRTSSIIVGDHQVERMVQRHALPPHSALELHLPSRDINMLSAWGECVTILWEAAMSCPQHPSCWNKLTARLLLWRAVVGPEESPVGEYARCQVIANLQSK